MLPSPLLQHMLARSMDGILSSRSRQTLQVRVVSGELGCTPTWSTLLQRGCTVTPPGSPWGFIQMTVPPVPMGMWHHSMRWHHTGLFKSSQLWISGSGSGSGTEGDYTHWQKWMLPAALLYRESSGATKRLGRGWEQPGRSPTCSVAAGTSRTPCATASCQSQLAQARHGCSMMERGGQETVQEQEAQSRSCLRAHRPWLGSCRLTHEERRAPAWCAGGKAGPWCAASSPVHG